MTNEKDLYQQLLDEGHSKSDIHKVLHTLMMEIIKNKQLQAQQTSIQSHKQNSFFASLMNNTSKN